MKIDSIKYRENLEIDETGDRIQIFNNRGPGGTIVEYLGPSEPSQVQDEATHTYPSFLAHMNPEEKPTGANGPLLADLSYLDSMDSSERYAGAIGPSDGPIFGWYKPFEGLSLDNIKGSTDSPTVGESLTKRLFMGVDPAQPETVVPVVYDTYGLKHPKADFILYAMKNKDLTIKTCYDLLPDEDPITLDNAIRRALQNESR